MGAGPVLNPRNWRPPYSPSPLVDTATGRSTDETDRSLRSLTTIIAGIAGYNVNQYGVRGNGVADDLPAFQQAVNDLLKAGGGVLMVPPGTFAFYSSLIFPAMIPNPQAAPPTMIPAPPIRVVGQGPSTNILRAKDLLPGMGLLDVSGNNVSFESFLIDGNVLVSRGLQYSVDFNTALSMNDPMAPVLTKNTSIWVHGPASFFSMTDLTVQHTGGYVAIGDAFTGSADTFKASDCFLINNRPFLFGTTLGDLNYGAWPGGILFNGDGRTVGSGVYTNIHVEGCDFRRGTGNQVWSHLYGLNELHQQFRAIDNDLEDIGLDGIEVGGISGGLVSANVFHRIGYICVDDTSPSVPRWLANLQATALDTSGLVLGVPYEGNTFTSINGGCLDLDGHSASSITGNVCRVPYPGEPGYVQDRISISGPTNTGSASYGLNLGNTQDSPYGGRAVTISANSFINLPGGSIRLFAARDCLVEANNIIVPDAPLSPPISYGPGGPGANQRATGNVIRNNRFQYNPAIPAPFVFEDPTIGPFLATDVNFVYDNYPIIGSTNAFEFQPDPNSGSGTTTAAVAGAATLQVTRGIITTEALVTAGAGVYTLTLTDSQMRTSSNLLVTVSNGTNTGGSAVLQSVVPANGSAVIKVLNNAGSAFNGTLKIQFTIQ